MTALSRNIVVKPEARVHCVGGTAFYLSAQFHPQYCGFALAAYLLLAWLGYAVRPNRERAPTALTLRPDKTTIILVGLSIVVLVQTTFLPNPLKPLTAFHLAFYALLVFGRSASTPMWPSSRIVHVVTAINTVLLLTYASPPLRDLFYFENVGTYRFRSYFIEPSVAAFIYVFNVTALLIETGKLSKSRRLLIGANVICLAATYSGSGFVLLMAILMSRFLKVSTLSNVRVFIAACAVIVAIYASGVANNSANELVTQRAMSVLDDNYDNSVHLRFVAPFWLAQEMGSDPVRLLMGAGVGGIGSYLDEIRPWYMAEYTGDQVYDINNGYVVLIGLFGYPLAVAFLIWLLIRVWRSRTPIEFKALLLLYPFFSGFIIHPFFWLLIGMTCVSSAGRPVIYAK